MPHANAYAPNAPDPAAAPGAGADLLGAYLDRLAATGRGSPPYVGAARRFFRSWPDPQDWAAQPLADRLAADHQTRPVITFLMLHHDGQPITFTQVAATTGLARSTLYRNAALRAVIEHHQQNNDGPLSPLSPLTDQLATLRVAVDTLAERVRSHEEQLRRLQN